MAQHRVFKLGGLGQPCCCVHTCLVTFCAGNHCCIASGVGAGTLVQVYTVGGGTLIVSGTTASNGCVTLDIGSAGTYDVHITFAGTTTVIVESSQALTCNSTKTYSGLNPGTVLCCNCCLMNSNPVGSGLFLTDSISTVELTYEIDCTGFFSGTGTWGGYVTVPTNIVQYNATTNVCSIVSGTTQVCYTVTCTSTTVGGITTWSVTVTRTWWMDWCQGGLHLCSALPGSYTFGYCPNPKASPPCCWSSGGTAAFGAPGQATTTLSVPSGITCNPFTWSSSLATVGSPAMPDPIGGTVVVQN
jgi:hypothetical protein